MTFRTRLFAAIALGTMALGSAATASKLAITSAGIYQPGTVLVSGPGFHRNEYAGAVRFDVQQPGGEGVSVVDGFCIDLFHNIYVGFDFGHDIVAGHGDAQYNNTLHYHTASLTRDSQSALSGGGTLLTMAQIKEIGGLANMGFSLIHSNAPDLSDKLTAIQSAIWTVEYAPKGFTVSSADIDVETYLNQDLKLAARPGFGGPSETIYADNGGTQGFTLGVPEPATWAMMIVGIGMVGGIQRRRQTIAAG